MDPISRVMEILSLLSRGFRHGSVSATEAELREMENAFALVLTGALTGMPAPPAYIGITLLPYLERELNVMMSRSLWHDDRLSEWAGMVDL